ncbi:hypothetical protein JCM5296_005785, partial [Sporobolomyces johnsonii]
MSVRDGGGKGGEGWSGCGAGRLCFKATTECFKATAETESARKLQRFGSDNGGEYSSRVFRAYLDEHGVAFESPPPYSPASNGVAEWVNHSILEGIRAMLHQAGARTSPSGPKPSSLRVDMLRVWGCRAWHTLANTKSKLDARAIPLVFVGYEGDTKAYRLLDPASKRIVRSRDARFQEDLFPLASPSPPTAAAIPVFEREAAPSPESPDPLDFLSDPFVAQAVALTAAVDEDLGAHDEAFSLPSRDPRNHREALVDVDSAGWLDGEKGEFLSLLNDYKVFHPVERSSVPPTAKILGGRFHYRRKGYGTTRTLKVRLVAQGYNQRPGLDFRETFAPVAKFTSIRVLLALAAQQRMRIQQADVDKVYLHADLDEELYMRVPDGVNGPEWDGKVLKLDRALYGLKQAGRAWNAKIHATLKRLGYQRTEEIDRVKGGLREQYGIKDLGDASCILGIDLANCHPASTPMIPNQQLVPTPVDSADDPQLRRRYLQAVSSLMYAMLGTRPDLAHAVGVLVSEAYSDSDWGACPTTSRSTMGFAFVLAGGTVSWSSRLQPRVAASSTEAEYLGLSHAGKEAIFLSQLLGELG